MRALPATIRLDCLDAAQVLLLSLALKCASATLLACNAHVQFKGLHPSVCTTPLMRRQRQAKAAEALGEPLLRSAPGNAGQAASTLDGAPSAGAQPDHDAGATGQGRCCLSLRADKTP